MVLKAISGATMGSVEVVDSIIMEEVVVEDISGNPDCAGLGLNTKELGFQ